MNDFFKADRQRVLDSLVYTEHTLFGDKTYNLTTLNGPTLTDPGDEVRLAKLGFVFRPHNYNAFIGQGAVWLNPDNALKPTSGHPALLLYAPTVSTSPPNPPDHHKAATDSLPDYPYHLIGWAYLAVDPDVPGPPPPFPPTTRPSLDPTLSSLAAIPPGHFFIHEAGIHPLDGGFIPTPPPNEVPPPSDTAPEGDASSPPPPTPGPGQAPRGSTTGAILGPPGHPRAWDVHIFIDPTSDGARSAVVDPFGTAPFGDRVPDGQPSARSGWFYQDPAAYQNPAFDYDLVLDMNNQPNGNDGSSDDIRVQITPPERGEQQVPTLEVDVNGKVLHRDPVALIHSLTIRGSNDDDTVTLPSDLGIPVAVDGGLGHNRIVVQGDTDYTLSDTQLITSAGLNVSLTNVQEANLTGGSSSNTFTVSDWSGTATLDGQGGGDSYQVNFAGNGAGTTTIQDSGGTGTLVVRGTGGADTLGVDYNRVTRGRETVNFGGVQQLTVDAGGGNDTIYVLGTATSTPVTINTGTGNVAIYVTTAAPVPFGVIGNTDTLFGALTINGQGGTDTLSVDDTANPRGDAWTITASGLTRPNVPQVFIIGSNPSPVQITYKKVAAVTLNAGNGNSAFSVQNTAAGTSMTLNVGAGNNTINVTTAASVPVGVIGSTDTLFGGLIINGQGGTDTLTVDDTANLRSDAWTITANSLTRPNVPTFFIIGSPPPPPVEISYSKLAAVTLSAGNGNNTFNVQGTAAGTPVTLNAGNGNDTINVTTMITVSSGRFVILTDTLYGPLNVNGQGGTNTLTVNDQLNSRNDPWTITANSVTRPNGAQLVGQSPPPPVQITYDKLAGLTLNAGGGDNTIAVQGTATSTPVTIDGGDGNDTITVTLGVVITIPLPHPFKSISHFTRTINSALTVKGGTGYDKLVLDDSQDTSNVSGTVTATTVTGLGLPQGLTHSGLERIEVYTGSGNDTVSNQVPAGGPLTVFLDLGAGQNGLVFDGTGGDDRIVVSWDFEPIDRPGTRADALAGRIAHREFAVVQINDRTFRSEYEHGQTITVHGGPGNDVIIIDPAAAHHWAITVDGGPGPGQDTLRVDASGTTGSATPPLLGADTIIAADQKPIHFVNIEFLQVTPATPATEADTFVHRLYRDMLDRNPDQAGFSTWVQQLLAGGSREQVVRGMWESAEHRGLQVDGFYATFLHRAADLGGRAAWVNALLHGIVEQDVARAFLVSPEYARTHPDVGTFVQGLYADILGGAPDPGGLAFWSQVAGSGLQGLGPAMAAQGLLTSTEGLRRLVDKYYVAFLGRLPDALGEQFWLDALQSGQESLASVAQALLASDEFFARMGAGTT
jgi:hypothetical protein